MSESLHIIDKNDEPKSLVADTEGTRDNSQVKNNPSLDNSDSKSPKRPNDSSISLSKRKVGVFFAFIVIITFLILFLFLWLMISDLKHV